jgi:hypothetical protein
MLSCEDVHWMYIGLIWSRICSGDGLFVRTIRRADSVLIPSLKILLQIVRHYKAASFPPVLFHTKSWYNFKLASANWVLSDESYGM